MLEHSDYGADLDAHLERVSSVDDYDAAAPAYRSLQFEWLVVAFGIGIGLYFALPIEPPLWLAAGVGAGAFIAIISFTRLLSRQGLSKFRAGLLILAVLIFGLGRATWHTKAIEAPILPDYRMAYNVTGWIEAVEMSGSGFRWRIRVDDMKLGARSLRADERPVRVRIRAKRAGLSPGDGVSVKAFMTGPPGPVIEDGYDPARRAYFKQIGGYGFAISTPVAADVSASGLDAARRKLAQTRHAMAQRIIAASPEQTAGLQAALLTGERAYIKKEQTESLRGAGLAHVLAISGLHMGLMAGGAFWLVAFVLAAIEPIGRSIDVRKPAALIGIIAATFYLALSGASVSTQRAFIMAVVMFSAVFLSRPAISMRSIAVAAALTLLLHPESLISAGFQMSFAAAGALVAVYGSLRQNFPAQYTPGLFRRGLNGFAALSITSAVAGTATGGFAAIHFHRVARYGFAANIIAMPIFTFVVMPMGLAAFIAMPFGLESIPLAIMSKGLVFMLAITDKFSQMEQSQWLFSAGPKYAAALYGAGFVLLCLGPLKKRLIGLGAIAVLTVMWMGVSQPDMRISEGADLAFWEVTEGGRILYVERKRADNYGREQFIERAGTPDADLMTYKQERADCDARACRIAFKGRTIAIATSPQIAAQECANADIVLLTERQAGPVTRRNCQALLLDAKSLERDGAQNLYFTDEGIKSVPANPPARRNRPWGQKRRR